MSIATNHRNKYGPAALAKVSAGPLENPINYQEISMHNLSEQRAAIPPARFEPTPEMTAAGTRIFEGMSYYIQSGSHGVTPTWTADGGTSYFIDAALRPLTGKQLDELIRCLTNVRETTAAAEPERIGPILDRMVEDLRLRASFNESRTGAPVGS